MNDIEEGSQHGSLTLKRLLTWCCVGAIMWIGIIEAAIKLCEVL